MALPNAARQKEVRAIFDRFVAQPETVFAIHYACQDLYDEHHVSSTRISCIAVHQLSAGRASVFSLAKTAELSGLGGGNVLQHLDEVEKDTLTSFYAFINTNKSAKFVHWLMNSEVYGFDAIAHRYRVLGGRPIDIHPNDRLDLEFVFRHVFGDDYASTRAKLEALCRLNRLQMAGFLPGKEEAASFQRGEFRKIQNSTQTKARLISDLACRFRDGRLETEATLATQYLPAVRQVVDTVWHNPVRSFMAAVAGSGWLIYQMLLWLNAG